MASQCDDPFYPEPPSACPADHSGLADFYITGVVLFGLMIFIKLSVSAMRERNPRGRGDPGTCTIILWAVMFLTGVIVLVTVYMFHTEEFDDAVLE